MKIVVTYTFILISLLNYAQNNPMNYTQKDLETKSKAELVEIALQIIKEKHPEIIVQPSDFDSRVWENEYGDVCVIFRRAIRYVSKEEKPTNYDITVTLISKKITPLDDDKTSFYEPSKKEEISIAELKKKGLLPNEIIPDIEYTITENDDYYLISCFNDLYHLDRKFSADTESPYLSKSLIHKKTGKTLFFKGPNAFYFLTQKSAKHYYQDNLYSILNEENVTNKSNKIVETAYSILKSKQPNLKINPKDFEITILGNYKDIIVKYRRYIRFKKNNEEKIFDLAVNIITKEVFPFDFSDAIFHIPSESDSNSINTIQHKIPLSLNPKMEHTISENNDYFWITSISEKWIKKYFINKNTNEVICFNESNTLPINNREDLSLQEHYKRMNGFFIIKTESNKSLIEMALAILKEKQFVPTINPDEYSIECKSSKDEVKIKFTRLIKFIPLRHKEESKYQHNLEVNLVSQTINQSLSQFYSPTEEDSNTIEWVKTKFTKHLKDSDETIYPIEIVEEIDCFIIQTSNSYNFEDGSIKKYRMDKKTAVVEIVTSSSNFFPSPAALPIPFNEIKK